MKRIEIIIVFPQGYAFLFLFFQFFLLQLQYAHVNVVG